MRDAGAPMQRPRGEQGTGPDLAAVSPLLRRGPPPSQAHVRGTPRGPATRPGLERGASAAGSRGRAAWHGVAQRSSQGGSESTLGHAPHCNRGVLGSTPVPRETEPRARLLMGPPGPASPRPCGEMPPRPARMDSPECACASGQAALLSSWASLALASPPCSGSPPAPLPPARRRERAASARGRVEGCWVWGGVLGWEAPDTGGREADGTYACQGPACTWQLPEEPSPGLLGTPSRPRAPGRVTGTTACCIWQTLSHPACRAWGLH